MNKWNKNIVYFKKKLFPEGISGIPLNSKGREEKILGGEKK